MRVRSKPCGGVGQESEGVGVGREEAGGYWKGGTRGDVQRKVGLPKTWPVIFILVLL